MTKPQGAKRKFTLSKLSAYVTKNDHKYLVYKTMIGADMFNGELNIKYMIKPVLTPALRGEGRKTMLSTLRDGRCKTMISSNQMTTTITRKKK
ncbi:hypothetical protein Hanom_Chr01g00004401 [Helianthus anomalus]